MKVRLFKIRLSKGWSRMLCTVSALLLPLFVSGQTSLRDSLRASSSLNFRVAYGSPFLFLDEKDNVRIVDDVPPLVVVDGGIWELGEKMNSFNFQDDSMDRKKVAELLGIKARKIKNITILKDAAATAVWGARGANGVLEVTTSYHRRYKHAHKDSIGK